MQFAREDDGIQPSLQRTDIIVRVLDEEGKNVIGYDIPFFERLAL